MRLVKMLPALVLTCLLGIGGCTSSAPPTPTASPTSVQPLSAAGTEGGQPAPPTSSPTETATQVAALERAIGLPPYPGARACSYLLQASPESFEVATQVCDRQYDKVAPHYKAWAQALKGAKVREIQTSGQRIFSVRHTTSGRELSLTMSESEAGCRVQLSCKPATLPTP